MAANMTFGRNAKNAQIASPENACVQEDVASVDLPDLEHNPAQLCPLVRHLPHLLLRVRGPLMGHRTTGDQYQDRKPESSILVYVLWLLWILTKGYGSQGTPKLLAILQRPSIIEGESNFGSL